ncbi:hypothetical protein AOLI_G00309170 [Acnodon oligacanthus]
MMNYKKWRMKDFPQHKMQGDVDASRWVTLTAGRSKGSHQMDGGGSARPQWVSTYSGSSILSDWERCSLDFKNRDLSSSCPNSWDEACDRAFQSLKDRLTSAPVLANADFSKPFIVEVDASHGGLGTVLSQEHEGKVHPIAFASKGLRPVERNMDSYRSMKLELLAVKEAVTENLREYLHGAQFTILTDNNPLSYLQTTKPGAIEQQWASQLASFNFTVKYHLGRSNENADALSRQYVEHFVYGTRVPPLSVELLESEPENVPTSQCREVVALTGCSSQDLHMLLEADPVCKFYKEE